MIINYKQMNTFTASSLSILHKTYKQMLLKSYVGQLKNAVLGSLFIGYAQCAKSVFFAVIFYVAARLLYKLESLTN